MPIKAALVDRLSGFAELSALVGTRIFNVTAPQGTVRPYLVYRRSGTPPRLASLQGSSGRARARFQFDGWADSADSMDAVSTALRHALDGYRGLHAGVDMGGATLMDEAEEYDVEVNGYHATQVFDVTHTED